MIHPHPPHPLRRCALALVLSLATLPALGASPADLQGLVDEARAHVDAGRYADALPLYERALAGGGPPELHYVIGRCHQELAAWEEARAAFRTYLSGDDLDPEARGRAELALAVVEERLSVGTLVLQVSPFGAAVTLDGRPVGHAPVEPMDLAPGAHTLRVSAPDHEPDERAVTLAGGRRLRVVVALAPAGGDGAPPPKPEETPTVREDATAGPARPTFGPWQWVTLGVGVAAVAGGTATYVLGELDHQDVQDALDDGFSPTDPDLRATDAAGDDKKLAGYVLWGVGGAALVTSTVLFVLEPDARPSPEAAGAHFQVAPTPGGAHVTFQGRF